MPLNKTAWSTSSVTPTAWTKGVLTTTALLSYLIRANSTVVTAGSTTVLVNGYDPSVEQLASGQNYIKQTAFSEQEAL